MSAYKIPPNTVVKVLTVVKGRDEKDVDDYLILDPTSHGRKLWVCENGFITNEWPGDGRCCGTYP